VFAITTAIVFVIRCQVRPHHARAEQFILDAAEGAARGTCSSKLNSAL
jgi:hypothetical protein